MTTQSTGKLLDQARSLVDRLYDAWWETKNIDKAIRIRRIVGKAEVREQRRFKAKQASLYL